MWGLSSRGAHFGGSRRPGRVIDLGLVRATVRGPAEHAMLDVAGELDFGCARDLVSAVGQLPHRIVALGLRDLEFADLAGARALIAICDEVEDRHGERPELVGATAAVRRALELVVAPGERRRIRA